MKNATKTLLILIFLLTSALDAAFGQTNIFVFDAPLNFETPLTTTEFPTGYPLSIRASHLRNCNAGHLSAADITEIYNAVKGTINDQNDPMGIPVLCAFFTTQFNADSLVVIKNQTHGFCFAFHKDNHLTLYYFESNLAGKFDPIPGLTTRINTISEDLFISLHYSHFSPGSYPDKSTIFSFICDTLGQVDSTDVSDMTITLSKDYKRLTGLFPIGMADSLILVSCEHPNGGVSSCGGACQVTISNTHCVAVTDSRGNATNQCVSGSDRCAAGAIERKAKEEGIELEVPVNYKMMRDFRDKFMTKYCEGRKYTGFYYTFSKYARMSIPMLWKYAALLPELYNAMDNLSDGNGNKIIVTPSIKAKVLEILQDHRDVGDEYFQSILKEVADDMEAYEGLKRNDLLSLLTPYGICSGQRKGIMESGIENSYFVSVFGNSNKDEIIVNYSVPGNSIKFELYSATAGIISSINRNSPKQKLIIPTSGLAPGVYIYRISSDSAYEKIGKVVVIK